jgi:hypothetical protein
MVTVAWRLLCDFKLALLLGGAGNSGRDKRTTIGKCAADTALRDINDLLARGELRKQQIKLHEIDSGSSPE